MGLIALALGAACLAALLLVGGLALSDRRPPLRAEPTDGGPADGGPADGGMPEDGLAGEPGRAVAVLAPDEAENGTIFSPAGTVREPWAEAVRRLGIEHPGAPDEALRAAVRYSLAVWSSLAGPDRAAAPAAQRLAVTMILADNASTARVLAWDRETWSRRTPLKDAALERDELFRRVAAALAG